MTAGCIDVYNHAAIQRRIVQCMR